MALVVLLAITTSQYSGNSETTTPAMSRRCRTTREGRTTPAFRGFGAGRTVLLTCLPS